MKLSPHDRLIQRLADDLAGVDVIRVFKGSRSHVHLNEPQASPWERLARELADGWRLMLETVRQLPEDSPWRQETEKYVAARDEAEKAREQEKRDEIKNTYRQKRQLKTRAPVWYAIPAADPGKGANCLMQWAALGYRTAVLLDAGNDPINADLVYFEDDYRGYPAAGNKLARLCLELGAEIVITGGDDIYPDPIAKPADVLKQFREHFGGTFGVMQPIGDDLAGTDRICGSPWMGRDFIQRINGGLGPWWHEYEHFFVDEEMFEVTKAMGILWQRDDLTQYHAHWGREGRFQPEYTKKYHERWHEYKRLFLKRKKAGFPGHEPHA